MKDIIYEKNDIDFTFNWPKESFVDKNNLTKQPHFFTKKCSGKIYKLKSNFLKFAFTRSWEKGENFSTKKRWNLHHLHVMNNIRCPSQKGKVFPFQRKTTPFTVEHQQVTLYTPLSCCHNFKLSNLSSPEYWQQYKNPHVYFMCDSGLVTTTRTSRVIWDEDI